MVNKTLRTIAAVIVVILTAVVSSATLALVGVLIGMLVESGYTYWEPTEWFRDSAVAIHGIGGSVVGLFLGAGAARRVYRKITGDGEKRRRRHWSFWL